MKFRDGKNVNVRFHCIFNGVGRESYIPGNSSRHILNDDKHGCHHQRYFQKISCFDQVTGRFIAPNKGNAFLQAMK